MSNDLNLELESQWDEVLRHWSSVPATGDCNFMFEVDSYFATIKSLAVLGAVKKAAISAEVKPYEDPKRLTTDKELLNAEFLTTPELTKPTIEALEKFSPSAKEHVITNEYFKDKYYAIETGLEIIDELAEEEYIKNNLRRLFEYYDDVTYTGKYNRGEIRAAYGAVGIPVSEVLEVLSGKTPIKDQHGMIRFLGLPRRIQHRAEGLQEAAIQSKKLVEQAVVTRELCSPEYIFKRFRKLKNKIIDHDQKRKHGTKLEQQHQHNQRLCS